MRNTHSKSIPLFPTSRDNFPITKKPGRTGHNGATSSTSPLSTGAQLSLVVCSSSPGQRQSISLSSTYSDHLSGSNPILYPAFTALSANKHSDKDLGSIFLQQAEKKPTPRIQSFPANCNTISWLKPVHIFWPFQKKSVCLSVALQCRVHTQEIWYEKCHQTCYSPFNRWAPGRWQWQ